MRLIKIMLCCVGLVVGAGCDEIMGDGGDAGSSSDAGSVVTVTDAGSSDAG